MKKLILFFVSVCLFFAQSLVFAVNEEPSFELWKRKQTYNDLVHRVGKQIQKENKIQRHYVYYAYGRGLPNAHLVPSYALVLVNSGTMKSMSSDDELAYVVGHEIAHKELGHGKYFRELGKRIIFPAKRYIDRKEEKAADLKSIDYMVKAGYDPFAALVVQDRILMEPDRFIVFKWFASHPGAKERMSLVGNYIMANYPEKKNGYFASKFRKESVYTDLIDWDGKVVNKNTSNPKLINELYQGDE